MSAEAGAKPAVTRHGKLPATVVTGFLGSGKTSLLRHVLAHAGGRRIAVIVNEFGEQGVDGELLRGCALACADEAGTGDGSGIYELANGCLCCTVQEAFFPVMEELVRRRAHVDHILIETSGLALPKPLVQAFQWPEIRATCTVDAVITVVDGPAAAAGQFAANPEAVAAQRAADDNLDHEAPLHELFADQLSAADLVILNKADQLQAAAQAGVERMIRAEAPPSVKIIPAAWGRVDPGVLLGLALASEEHIDERPSHHDRHHTEDAEHDHEQFDSVTVRLGAVDLPRLLRVLRDITRALPVYRIKGFAHLPDKPMRLVLHGVGTRFEQYFDRHWAADERRATQIVLIGAALDAAHLRRRLAAAELQPAAAPNAAPTAAV